MKIGILTQPLHTNYGGLLQAYALQTVLKRMGHEVLTVDILFRKTFFCTCRGVIARFILKYILGRKDILNVFSVEPTKSEYQVIAQYTNKFIKKNIKTTDKIPLVEKISILDKYNFDSYVVGSDQVWRPCYSPGIKTFFLDFLKEDKKTKRVAYAASFGVDRWEYGPSLTKKCKKLAQKFDAISVREDSGIKLCNEYLGVKAINSLDPTMLLDKEDYISLVSKDNVPNKEGTLMVYVLDNTVEKEFIVQKVSNQLNLAVNSVTALKKYSKENRINLEDCIFPSVTHWLRGFMDAEFVVTDSFHGTVFSIIFNKPFITIGNKSRGLSRLTSLLKIFSLENRLISSENDLSKDLIYESIDFEKVNRIRNEQKKVAIDFLSNNLNK